jgi:hypothetical protein
MLALSTLVFILAGGCVVHGKDAGGGQMPGAASGKQPAAKIHDAIEDLFGRFAHQDFFSVEQSDYGVGTLLYKLDQVRVDGDVRVIQTSEMDHDARGRRCPQLSIGRR